MAPIYKECQQGSRHTQGQPTMTYENKYSLRVVKGHKDIHGLTLYEAEKALAQAEKTWAN